MKFEYKLHVEGWGFTFCANGIDLDNTVHSELKEIDPRRITITIKPIAEIAETIIANIPATKPLAYMKIYGLSVPDDDQPK